MFPQRYRGGAFIAFHGSWNRAPLPQQGFKVVFQPMSGDKPAGEFETFIEGAAPAPDATSREGRLRPTGLAQGPDGALYLTDDGRGIVWRITAGGR
jgi:glucose/arabinose dehydrogenase